MPDAIVTSFAVPNYSGMLFNKGNTRTPLSSIIGSKMATTNSVEFVVGQEYTGGGEGSQPAISEAASLTAPDATRATRSQITNVTQIFHESVYVSYAKQSNMGTLSGANIANQQANPMNELDFQIGVKMQKIARDVEYTYINGVYQKAAADDQANKTRGLIPAITSNVMDLDGKPLTYWSVAEMLKEIYGAYAPTDDLCLWVDSTVLLQLNADAKMNDMTIVPAARDINGIKLDQVITPHGTIYIHLGECMPGGTAILLNLGVIRPVQQPVPGKGNFFREELSKTGAGEKHQIFGQLGLDHGPEWYHGKFTGVSTTFTAPKSGKAVYMVTPASVVEVDATLEAAILDKSTVDPSDTAKVAVETLSYDVVPGTDPSLTYLWQIRAKNSTTWTDLTSSYTGYNTSELTIKAADAEKHYRCKVSASGSAKGTVYSDECTVNASA